MNYILNVINILVYINSASNHTCFASVMLCCASCKIWNQLIVIYNNHIR
jgi:hypothetical protein